MARRVVVLDSAKEEFKDIKQHVKKEFGECVWNTVNAEYKQAIRLLKDTPEIGRDIDELKALGITNFKFVLIRQTRIVYELDQDLVLVHMFINTKRDFRVHLLKRILTHSPIPE